MPSDHNENQPYQYYMQQGLKMVQDEKTTLSVDYRHLSSFQWQDPLFMDKLLQEYNRFEVYLREAATKHLSDRCGYSIGKGKFILLAIYNLPNINKIRDLKTGSLGRMMSI